MPEGSIGSNPEVNQPIRLPPGQAFWDKLTPEMQAVIEQPIRKTEEMIAQQFLDGYSSPLVAKARAIRDEDHLERQHDLTSCTLVATANALRVVDQPRAEYSKDTLKARAEELSGRNQPIVGPENLRQIFSSASPFNQFSLRVLPDVKPFMDNMNKDSGLMVGIAKDVWVVHKGKPQIVVQGRK